MPQNTPDKLENDILRRWPEVLRALLKDHTTNRNIFWATDMYEKEYGESYSFSHQITVEQITGSNGTIIRPRAVKSTDEQRYRIRDKAEVFTPSWICNAQNSLVEDALPNDMSWQDYVRLTCLEITCGEAPYLASRYDAATGEQIPLEKRIGLLDHKLRLVNDKTETKEEWLEWARIAYQNTYGYEWQGDNLLLARQSLLFTFIDYYHVKFGEHPAEANIHGIADIISWNLWQMDGLRGVPPDYPSPGELLDNPVPDMFTTYCVIRDWDEDKEVRYVDLIKL